MKEKKVFSISTHKGDSEWLEMKSVDNLDDADILYIHSYTDLHPGSYLLSSQGQIGAYTNGRLDSDKYHLDILKQAIKSRKIIIGANKGLHLIAVNQGAGLVQHMQHPGKHRLTMYDDSKMVVNSYHHQLVSLLRMTSDKYQLIGYASELSPFYLNGFNKGFSAFSKTSEGRIIDPEIIHFPIVRSLGFQFNPNEFPASSDSYKICKGLVNRLIDNKLYNGITLKIPLNDLIEEDFSFSKEHIKDLISKREMAYAL